MNSRWQTPNSEEAQVGPLPYYERPPLPRFPMRDQSGTIATVSSKTPARGNGYVDVGRHVIHDTGGSRGALGAAMA